MIYLLWAIVNIGLAGLFLAICFNAAKLVKEKYGVLFTLVLVIGLLSFVGGANNDNDNREPGTNQVRTWKFNTPETLNKQATAYIQVDFEKTAISRYILGISYARNREMQEYIQGISYARNREMQEYIPLSANTTISGLRSGTSWKPGSVVVNRTNDSNKFE